MKIRIAVASDESGGCCAHGADTLTERGMADNVRSAKLGDQVPVRFFEIDLDKAEEFFPFSN